MMLFQTLLGTRLNTGAPSLIGVSEADILTSIFKILFILSVVFYIVFAVIVIRQVQIMKNTLITPISPVILLFSVIHLFMALAVLLLFFVIL